jgi:hypothetical protein
VAEGARLESVYTGNRIVGSNPTPSASLPFAFARQAGPLAGVLVLIYLTLPSRMDITMSGRTGIRVIRAP